MAVGEGLAGDGGSGAVDYGLGGGERGRGGRRRLVTRLWSMISAMMAILPVEGPALRRTTGTGEHRR